MSTLTNLMILFFPNLFARLLLFNLNSLREYTNINISSELVFLSSEQKSVNTRKHIIEIEKETFSQKDLATFTRYERFCYLRELILFLATYRTNLARFLHNNWEDQLVVSVGNDPISNVFNLNTIPVSRREIFPEAFKEVSHNLGTGRLLFGSSLTSSSFDKSFVYRPVSIGKNFSKQVGEHYHSYRKSINVPRIERWNLLKVNRRTPSWSDPNHRSIMRNLKFTPSFIPVNSFYHPILSIPPGEYLMNTLDRIHYFIFDWFIWESDNLSLPIRKGFVFFNGDDASEYVDSVKEQSSRIAKRYSPLQVFPINLGLAYKWNRTSPPRLQFRFVPDIKEVGDLVTKYQYQHNIHIHPSQFITKNQFKGVPIYTIKTIVVQDEGKKIKVDLNYGADSSYGQKFLIFTSLNSLYKEWKKICVQHTRLTLPNKPVVQVYNLEDYISDCEALLTNQCKNFRIVPSEDAYNFTVDKGHQHHKSIISYYYNYKLMPLAKRLNLWSRYFFWSLTTSRRPDW